MVIILITTFNLFDKQLSCYDFEFCPCSRSHKGPTVFGFDFPPSSPNEFFFLVLSYNFLYKPKQKVIDHTVFCLSLPLPMYHSALERNIK